LPPASAGGGQLQFFSLPSALQRASRSGLQPFNRIVGQGLVRGFTLIELMIVVSILAIISVPAYRAVTQLGETRLRMEARLDAQQEAQLAVARWRADVTMATRAQWNPAAGVLLLSQATPDGGEVQVRYEWTPRGALLRRVASDGQSLAETLVREASAAAFEPSGRGWRVRWTRAFDDQTIRLRWTFGGVATPLIES
jgi:prepilin-type N-terminal cleavage/methylation domain-containing protein